MSPRRNARSRRPRCRRGASAKLTPAEQKWATAADHGLERAEQRLTSVIPQARSQERARRRREAANNMTLTKTLAALIDCRTPKAKIKKAGAPPSPRLRPFAGAARAPRARHDTAGPTTSRRRSGRSRSKNDARRDASSRQGVAEFKLGTAALQGLQALVALGGKNIFAA